MIDYNTWKLKQWANLYKEKSIENGFENANNFIWNKWNTKENKYKENFLFPELLILKLATYRDRTTISSNGAFTITADSIPIYATWTNYIYGVYFWDLVQWKFWFIELEIKFGLIEAQKRFHNAWSYSDNYSWGVNQDGMGYVGGYDCDFINFFRTQGLDVALFGAENLCTLVGTGTNLIQATENVSEVVEGVTGGASILASYTPFILIGGAGLYAYVQIKKVNK